MAAVSILLLGLLICLYQWWQKPPAVQHDNLRYIQLMRTAVSSRSPDQVQRVQQAIDQRLESGLMTAAERQHFETIIALSRNGQWELADRRCFDFEAAQIGRRR